MPKDINSQSWKTEVADIKLKNCVIVPLEYMRQMEQEIEMAYIHMEWNSKEVSDTTFEKDRELSDRNSWKCIFLSYLFAGN